MSCALPLLPAIGSTKFTETYCETSTAVTQMNRQMELAFTFRSYGGKGELTTVAVNNPVVSLKTKDEEKLGREKKDRQEIDAIL